MSLGDHEWEGRSCFKVKGVEGLPLECPSPNPVAKEVEGSRGGGGAAVEGSFLFCHVWVERE